MSEPTPIEVHCAVGRQRLLFGPADAEGVIRISPAELWAKATAEIDVFPMDYSGFPERWTGTVQADVVDLDGVNRLRSAMELWGGDSYPPDFERILNEYEQNLLRLDPAELRNLSRDGRAT